jgi:WD40 repeat protein/tRNA A-37 threonylcarbamoyl transferase component Bud32
MNPAGPAIYEALGPVQAALVDAVCDRFESAWRETQAGAEPPVLQSYLEGQPETVRSALARELIALDRAYRQRRGEPAGLDEYGKFSEPKLAGSDEGQAENHWPELPGLQIVKVLGAGGMGIVFKAWQLALGRFVAVKMLRHANLHDAEHRERFSLEARAIAQLQHPHIVQIFAIGELPATGAADPVPYFVMEYVAGGSLAEALRGHPQPPRAAAQLVETLARALHHAHLQGVIHRDLKPANVLLQRVEASDEQKSELSAGSMSLESGRFELKITDFGLAKLALGSDLTQTGDTLGTPSYMAPEQVDSTVGDIRQQTDVYGLGAILYETLTGRPPFEADTALATVVQVRQDEPLPLRRLQPTVPAELETICLKCLQKNPQHRYANALALADDLRRFLEGRPIVASPATLAQRAWKWMRRHPAVAGLSLVSGLAALLLLIVLAVSHVWLQAEQQQTQAALDAERVTLYYHRIRLTQAALHDNNARQAERYLAACVPQANQRDLRGWEWFYLQGLCHPELVSWDVGATQLAFQAQGRIATLDTKRQVQIWDYATGVALRSQTYSSTAAKWRAAFNADGELLAIGDESTDSLKVYTAVDGKELYTFQGCTPVFSSAGRKLATIDAAEGQARIYDLTSGKELRHCMLSGSEQGRQYVFHSDALWEAVAAADRSIHVRNVESGDEQFAAQGPAVGHFFLTFSADGQRLAAAGEEGTIQIWDTNRGAELSHFKAHLGNITSLAFSADHQWLASGDLSGAVKEWDLQGRETRALPGHGVMVSRLAFDDDGRLLASVGVDQKIKLWDLGRDTQVALAGKHVSYVCSLSFSPSGQQLATAGFDETLNVWDLATGRLSVSRPTNLGIIRQAVFTSGGDRIVACNSLAAVKAWKASDLQELSTRSGDGEMNSTAMSLSPDGSLLAAPQADGAISLRDAASGQELHRLEGHTQSIVKASFSWDQRLLASVSNDQTIKVWNTPTGSNVCTFPGHTGQPLCAAFSADGRHVVSAGHDTAIRMWDATTGEQVREFNSQWGRAIVYTVALSPDGKRLASGGIYAYVTLWDTATGQEILEIPTGHMIVTHVAFSPDGRRLAAACNDGALLVWDAAHQIMPDN